MRHNRNKLSSAWRAVSSIWHAAVNWFEHGDLVPLIVIVSAVHYSSMLQAHDVFLVATAIGLMVDLGHYRTVRAAVRYNGRQTRTQALRWVVAAFMTSVSIAYQQRFYGDLWLSLPLPLLIVSLAWLQETDKSLGRKPKRSDIVSETPVKVAETIVKSAKPVSDIETIVSDKSNGYASLTIDEIMERDGVSRSTAYRRKRA